MTRNCHKGVKVTWKDLTGDHLLGAELGAGDATTWLHDRFDNVPACACA